MPLVSRFAGLVLLATIAAACASAVPPEATPVHADRVTIVDDAFEPPVIEISPGTTVTWTWAGSHPHDVAGEGWSSDAQTSGTFTHTFEAAGTYDYVCHVHSNMAGRVIVGG
jgi:plastocyanin